MSADGAWPSADTVVTKRWHVSFIIYFGPLMVLTFCWSLPLFKMPWEIWWDISINTHINGFIQTHKAKHFTSSSPWQLMSAISMTTHVRHLHDNCSAYHLGKPVVWRGQSDYWNHVALSLDKMAAVSQTIFSGAFSWMKSLVFWFKFHWSLFLVVQLTITQYWFR